MSTPRPAPALVPALLLYAAASLFHHVHNATDLADYPNLPAWLTPAKVYLAWAAVTAVGLCGYLLQRRGRSAGLALIGAYAALGLAGLEHYARAPLAAHSAMMNLSILTEVGAALVLLAVVAAHALPRARRPRARA
ncbi:MAG: hypothetical protein JSR36_13915 [Proteobacteria bacterium]|nr:hypothetical protein [Pseudomonadota bacterium]